MNMTHTEKSKLFKCTSSWLVTKCTPRTPPSRPKNGILLHCRSPFLPNKSLSPHLQAVIGFPIFYDNPFLPFLYSLSTQIYNCMYYSFVFKILDTSSSVIHILLSLASSTWWTTAELPFVLAWWRWDFAQFAFAWRCLYCISITTGYYCAGYRILAWQLFSASSLTLFISLSSDFCFYCWEESCQFQLTWVFLKETCLFFLSLRIKKFPSLLVFRSYTITIL